MLGGTPSRSEPTLQPGETATPALLRRELRAPLAAISSALELLSEGPDRISKEERYALIANAARQAHRLEDSLNRFLTD